MATSNSWILTAFLFVAVFANRSHGCAQRVIAAQQATSLQVTAEAALDEGVEQVLQQMTLAAGVVFAGEVVSVQRPGGYAGSGLDAAEGVVTVRFRVDEAVRGRMSGPVYTLREWSGLWAGGDRFSVGQHLLVFLYSPGANGLASPVHGAEGAILLRGGGVAPGPYDVSATAAGWLVDLRWVRVHAVRGSGPGPVDPGGQPAHGPISEALRTLNQVPMPESMPDLLPRPGGFAHWTALPQTSDRAMPPLAGVLSLCRAWARSADARK